MKHWLVNQSDGWHTTVFVVVASSRAKAVVLATAYCGPDKAAIKIQELPTIQGVYQYVEI